MPFSETSKNCDHECFKGTLKTSAHPGHPCPIGEDCDRRNFDGAIKTAPLSGIEGDHFPLEDNYPPEIEHPEHEPCHPDLRAMRVEQTAANAPDRITEIRERSVSVGREDVKVDTEPYLRDQYTNSDDVMFCQICNTALPFKLDDGSYYMEKVEFLTDLKKRHYQNYLALCPNHAAMFRYANASRDKMRGLFEKMQGNELDVILAAEHRKIHFTKTHIVDLKAVLAAEKTSNGEGDV